MRKRGMVILVFFFSREQASEINVFQRYSPLRLQGRIDFLSSSGIDYVIRHFGL
jgi:hypothetical protein